MKFELFEGTPEGPKFPGDILNKWYCFRYGRPQDVYCIYLDGSFQKADADMLNDIHEWKRDRHLIEIKTFPNDMVQYLPPIFVAQFRMEGII